MAKDPAFPFYAQDYLVDTLRWDRLMKSLHIDLLAESWANGAQALTDDNGHIKFLNEDDRKIWDRIKYKWVLIDGHWNNSKLEETRTSRKFFKEQQSIKGKKSAEKRFNNQTIVEPLLNHSSTLEKENESEKEIINDLKGEEIFELEVSPTFDDFWDEYDKKKGDKGKLKVKWKKLKQDEREKIMEYIPNYKASQPDKTYRKDPETFLNNKSWNDELIYKTNGKQNTTNDRRQKFTNYFTGQTQ